MNLGNLDFRIGSVNPSGIGTTIYRIAKRHITSWPTIVNNTDDAEGAEDLVKYDGDFVLAANAVFEKIYSTQGKGKLTFESTGETDCKMYLNKATFSFPDLTPAALGFSKAAVNDDYVYIAKAAGRYHVIGSEDYRSVTTPGGDTGDAAGSAKGVTFNVECPDVTPLPIYEGTIKLADGTLDLATGVLTPAEGK